MNRPNNSGVEKSPKLLLYRKKRQARVFEISERTSESTKYDKAHDEMPDIDLKFLELPRYRTMLHEELDQKLFVSQRNTNK
jgi:hypothetical protein